VCQAIVEEHPDRVYVRAWPAGTRTSPAATHHILRMPRWTGPCNVWLDAPLDTLMVMDIDSGWPLSLFVPGWGTEEHSVYIPRPNGALWPPSHRD
jgi:hypothetical protein